MKVAPTGTDPTPSTSRAAGVLLFYKDAVLLGKRCVEYRGHPVVFGGYWSPFTGAIEEGENPLVCGQRELREETGLEVPLHSLKYIKEVSGPNRSLILYAHELNFLFKPTLDEEHTTADYFKISTLPSLSPLDAGILEVINFYCDTLRIKNS
tara:strand:- start:407 stop:862 length:456 start_codon:yes stop_codon:yes gene_type:complete